IAEWKRGARRIARRPVHWRCSRMLSQDAIGRGLTGGDDIRDADAAQHVASNRQPRDAPDARLDARHTIEMAERVLRARVLAAEHARQHGLTLDPADLAQLLAKHVDKLV